MVLILQTIIDCNGNVLEKYFAHLLNDWVTKGFPELGDNFGPGIGATTWKVVNHKSFLENPHGVAEAIWEHYGCDLAANGAQLFH